MKISLSKNKLTKSNKKKLEKFLLFPLFYRGSIFWLEKVIIRKNFNGMSYQITDVQKARSV